MSEVSWWMQILEDENAQMGAWLKDALTSGELEFSPNREDIRLFLGLDVPEWDWSK